MATEGTSNITLRKIRKTTSHNNVSVMNTSDSSLFDTTMQSLPDPCDTFEVHDLQVKLSSVQEKLLIANSEIENLNTENTSLKWELERCHKIIELYKKVGYGESFSTPPTSARKKKKKVENVTNTSSIKLNDQRVVIAEKSVSVEQPRQDTCSKRSSTSNQDMENVDKDITPSVCKKSQLIRHKNKLCILSTNNKNKILSITENTFANTFDCCHYVIPNGKTQHLLKGLKEKLVKFTINDFCVILLGDEDFKNTNNYFEIIFHIREVLQNIHHTNVIICAPTYKYGYNANLFNCRVETFNSLLYLDVLTYEHLYLLDSNLNLSYDYNLYDKRTGSVSNRGMYIIFKDLNDLIIDIQYNNSKCDEIDIPKENNLTNKDTFFLD